VRGFGSGRGPQNPWGGWRVPSALDAATALDAALGDPSLTSFVSRNGVDQARGVGVLRVSAIALPDGCRLQRCVSLQRGPIEGARWRGALYSGLPMISVARKSRPAGARRSSSASTARLLRST